MAPLDQLTLPIIDLKQVSMLGAILNYPPVKALLPLPILVLIAPALWWFFRDTWRALDLETVGGTATRPQPQQHWQKWRRSHKKAPLAGLRRKAAISSARELDYRPAVCLVIVAIVLTLHEYYGGRSFYESAIRPILSDAAPNHAWLRFKQFDELYGYAWWVTSRVVGYVGPVLLWKLFFPKDSILDMGLRTRGFMSHLWIYIAALAVVIAAMMVLATQPEFLNYYPFYKRCSRSWFDFLTWQAMYWAQFFALELFFRGWMLAALRRTMGMGAIFVMVVPYCMIHYGKPYLEAHAAIVAGVVLGSLAMRTRSIYAGFLVHISVATLMDTMALASRDALPTQFWPPDVD